MSALLPKADILIVGIDVCFVPITDISRGDRNDEHACSVHAFLIGERRGSLHVRFSGTRGFALPDAADLNLELYKLYLETAETVSERRAAANTWMLSVNSAIVALY